MVYRFISYMIAILATSFAGGCGTTKLQEATEQLVLSAAVDRSVAMIDFRPLAGQRVFLDTSYMRNVKSPTFVNADYVTSALRQQIMAAGCFLQEQREYADIIIESRIGTLGADDHRVTYGIPENNGLASAATLLAQTPTPSIPEIAVARRDAREGAAKIAVFAYDRETRTPLWQSGISQSIATSRNTWVMGVGPFQGGSIREGTQLAKGNSRSGRTRPGASPSQPFDRPVVEHTAEVRYDHGWPLVGRTPSHGAFVGSGLPLQPKRLPSVDGETVNTSSEVADALEASEPSEQSDDPEALIAEEPGMLDDNTLQR